jgi:hypothetical protein
MLRPYSEQKKIDGFERLDNTRRRASILQLRKKELLDLQKAKNPGRYNQTKKNYKQTEAYIHLTYQERQDLVREIAQCVSRWGFARLFAECVDKIFFDPSKTTQQIDEQSFEQLVSRFAQCLQGISRKAVDNCSGLLIHDNNPTVAKKHTDLMKKFHERGTMWTSVSNIIETPLFVDSQLTSMVQIADLCAYAIRRYLENGEEELFDLIFKRADRRGTVVVGVRHFTNKTCACKICVPHKKRTTSGAS